MENIAKVNAEDSTLVCSGGRPAVVILLGLTALYPTLTFKFVAKIKLLLTVVPLCSSYLLHSFYFDAFSLTPGLTPPSSQSTIKNQVLGKTPRLVL